MDYDQFTHGGVGYPLPASLEYSLLRDADPAIYWTLEYLSAVLERYVAPRLLLEAAQCRMNLPRAVVQKLWVPPEPDLFADQLQFPTLVLHRVRETYADKTIATAVDLAEWEYAWVLPPLQQAALKRLQPILRSVAAVIRQTIDAGGDPAYDSGVRVWERAGVAGIRVAEAHYGRYAHVEGNSTFYKAVWGSIFASEIAPPAVDSLQPFEGVRVHVDVASETAATLQDVVEYDSHPVIASVIPNFGSSSGGTSVVLKGAGFGPGDTVYFGNAAATAVATVDQLNITCTTPPGTGIVDVRVISADGRPGRKIMAFTYS